MSHIRHENIVNGVKRPFVAPIDDPLARMYGRVAFEGCYLFLKDAENYPMTRPRMGGRYLGTCCCS